MCVPEDLSLLLSSLVNVLYSIFLTTILSTDTVLYCT